MKTKEEKYTQKISIPHYKITGNKPLISELLNEVKAEELQKNLTKANVSEAEKKFLKKASYRHLAFNYRKIAEYYANASKEMQELMEKSALVIIDYDDAIKNGYALYSKRINELRKNNA